MKSASWKLPSVFKYYFLVIFLSLLPLLKVIFTQDLSHTHDGLMHLARIAAFFKSFSDGQIPVRWAGDLNYGYGMPLFNFIYHLPYFISSFFIFLGFGLINTFKIVLTLSFILSGIFMFAFSKRFFEDSKKALLATLFYQFAPFRLVEVIDRGSFGEVYAYAFLPLVLFGLVKLFKTKNFYNFFLTSFAAALLIISHNSISLVFFAICTGFIIFFAKEKKQYFHGFSSLLFGLFISAYYWIPALLEHKYTYGDLLMKDIYLSHFPPIQNFFIPNLTNLASLKIGAVSVQFGLFHVGAIIFSLILLFKKKVDKQFKKIAVFSLLLIVISLFFMQPISKHVWANVSFLRQFQFSWRLLSVVSFATAFLSVAF
ncbi:MAG: 6-pyruvoyl-tetrahydropterin synthase-related protein, partial [bacterium]|nr:6-pyruvoyl-tetrahydropterin synthase-related protein [bacterium]